MVISLFFLSSGIIKDSLLSVMNLHFKVFMNWIEFHMQIIIAEDVVRWSKWIFFFLKSTTKVITSIFNFNLFLFHFLYCFMMMKEKQKPELNEYIWLQSSSSSLWINRDLCSMLIENFSRKRFSFFSPISTTSKKKI